MGRVDLSYRQFFSDMEGSEGTSELGLVFLPHVPMTFFIRIEGQRAQDLWEVERVFALKGKERIQQGCFTHQP